MKISLEKLFRIYAFIVILNIAIFTLLFFLFPNLQNFLFNEDKLVEGLTVLFYLLSFLVGIVFIVRLKEKKYPRIYIAFPFLSLIGALEELSYGQNILKFKMPSIYGVEFDSLHDVIQLGQKIIEEHSNAFLYLVASFCFVSLILLLKYRKYFSQIPDILRKYPPVGFFLMSLSFNASAQVFDLEHVKPLFFVALEEIFEMNGALTMIFVAFSIGYPRISNENLEQSESKFLKKMPVLIGTIVLLFVLFSSANLFGLSTYTNRIKKQSRAYAERVIPLIFSSWDAEAMVNNMPSDFYTEEFYQKIKVSFALHEEKLGKLKNYKIIKDKLKGLKQTSFDREMAVFFEHYAFVKFQKATTRLLIKTVLIKNKWYLTFIKLDPIK